MSVRLNSLDVVRITVDPRHLETLLEALGGLPFPVNPSISHHTGPKPDAVVEFPAYEDTLAEVRARLMKAGFAGDCLEIRGILDRITSPSTTSDS
jgi:hypothetical protein